MTYVREQAAGAPWHVMKPHNDRWPDRVATLCGIDLAGRNVRRREIAVADTLPEWNVHDLCRRNGCRGEFDVGATRRDTVAPVGTSDTVATETVRAEFETAVDLLRRLGRETSVVTLDDVGVEARVGMPVALFSMLVRSLAAHEAGSLDVNRSTPARTGEWP